MVFLTEIEQKTLKFVWNLKTPQRAKAILRNKNKDEDSTYPDVTVWY